jgi:hypothetical protein
LCIMRVSAFALLFRSSADSSAGDQQGARENSAQAGRSHGPRIVAGGR